MIVLLFLLKFLPVLIQFLRLVICLIFKLLIFHLSHQIPSTHKSQEPLVSLDQTTSSQPLIRAKILLSKPFQALIMDAATLAPEVISKITDAEKKITHRDNPVADGPTAKAQKHAGEKIDSEVLHDITEGQKHVTKSNCPVAGGPTAIVQSHLAKVREEKVISLGC